MFVVVGHYCPTDCNPETDARPDESAALCRTRPEAENMLLWYPDGRIVPVQ